MTRHAPGYQDAFTANENLTDVQALFKIMRIKQKQDEFLHSEKGLKALRNIHPPNPFANTFQSNLSSCPNHLTPKFSLVPYENHISQ